MTELTAGQLLDLLHRAHQAIVDMQAKEHAQLVIDLSEAAGFVAEEILASRFCSGADAVLLERGGL
jgi:hypothetical protein